MRKILLFLLVCTVLTPFSFSTEANAKYPFDRPINIIIPFGPGGNNDIVARIMADYLLEKHDINVNVINRPGGGQAIGMTEVLKARPDGYTFGFPSFSAFATVPKISNVGFTYDNFKPVMQLMSLELLYTVPADSDIKTFEDYVAAVKNDPDFVFATTAAISVQRLYNTQVFNRFHPELKPRHTAFNSNNEVNTALLGKHIDMGLQVPATAMPYLDSGDIRAIAITGNQRHPELPNVPTIAEIYDGTRTADDDFWIYTTSWTGFVASKKMKDETIATILPYFKEALEAPETVEKLAKLGVIPAYLGPEDFDKVIRGSSDLADNVLQGRKSLD